MDGVIEYEYPLSSLKDGRTQVACVRKPFNPLAPSGAAMLIRGKDYIMEDNPTNPERVNQIVTAIVRDALWHEINGSLPLSLLRDLYFALDDYAGVERDYRQFAGIEPTGSSERINHCECGSRLVITAVHGWFCAAAKRDGLSGDARMRDYWINPVHSFLDYCKWCSSDREIWAAVLDDRCNWEQFNSEVTTERWGGFDLRSAYSDPQRSPLI